MAGHAAIGQILISFIEDGKLMVSDDLSEEELDDLGLAGGDHCRVLTKRTSFTRSTIKFASVGDGLRPAAAEIVGGRGVIRRGRPRSLPSTATPREGRRRALLTIETCARLSALSASRIPFRRPGQPSTWLSGRPETVQMTLAV